ncbi:MAG TPA: DapH/DapD/GlmU-related protein [Nocardioides sp.]|nr:DapH/DapD/GlmU-related protein [Nocardioides sp.]
MQPGDSSHGLSFGQLVFSDLRRVRPGARASWLGVLLRIPFEPAVLASLLLRAQQCLHRSGHTRLAGGLRTLGNSLIGADFGAGMTVGTGFAMVHPVGVTMGFGARVGDNVTFAGGVVLAARYYDEDHAGEQEFPVIDDGAVIGAHAVLVGGVRIGKNATVGANSVVLKDVADNTVVLGNPAKRVGIREAPPDPSRVTPT